MSDHPENMTTRADRPRTGKGRYDANPATAERDAKAADLRARGYTPLQISKQLGMGLSTVYEALDRHYTAVRREPGPQALELELERLDASLQRLDRMEELANATLKTRKITVSQGRAIYDDTGEPVWDDEFVLKVLDRLTKIEQQRERVGNRMAQLRGLNAPTQQQVTGTVTYEIIGLDTPTDGT